MTILLDSHAFFWWVTDEDKLSGLAKRTIADEQQVYVRCRGLGNGYEGQVTQMA
jgi:PIN domain nuclease of toxin-antitoxin system